MINILIIIVLSSFFIIPFASVKLKGIVTLSVISIIAAITSWTAVNALLGKNFGVTMAGPELFGNIDIKVDALSGWFILVINFTLLTGAYYGFSYMKAYSNRVNEITLHCIAFILVQFSLTGICSVQNGFAFLLLWELMTLGVFILVIFEHEKSDTVKAGINFLIQSHISIVLIMLGFIFSAYLTGSYGFDAFAILSSRQSTLTGTALFLCFFAGFAIKAGFVPFHTWLPYAHPAAPTHVSAIMSGVIIKIGIYGILRMLLLIRVDYVTVGYLILFISTITGIYGVMLATVQHNLKKLLAYHSIENIGIIGMGIGIGTIGLGETNKWMAILGFSGALLHTLNHSLFKSLLFYSAGNVYQAAKTMNIERLGGLMKKMPRTAILFLVAAIAICGLPPLNGFISEFMIFGGLYNWLYSANLISLITIIFTVTALVLIGGLALLCFTKAYGIVFLGNSRDIEIDTLSERGSGHLVPMYFALALMISIGLFPSFYLGILQGPVNLFTHNIVFNLNLIKVGAIDSLRVINWIFLLLIGLTALILGLKKLSQKGRTIETGPTWGCGYSLSGSKLQYTANSFVRTYAKLAKPILDIEKKETEVEGIFPGPADYRTEPCDKIEKNLIDRPFKFVNRISDIFLFLQNGHLQRYILYGIIFITGVICIPLIIEKILSVIYLLNIM